MTPTDHEDEPEGDEPDADETAAEPETDETAAEPKTDETEAVDDAETDDDAESDDDAEPASDRLAGWKRSVAVPRWAVVSGIGVVALLVILAITAGSLALTEPGDPDEATEDQPGPVTIHDEFGRSGATLGTTNSGQEWDEVQGRWAATVLGAQVVATDGDLPSIAVVDLEDTDGSVRMQGAKVVDGMGLVVRYRNPSNYVAIVAARTFATWTVRQVVNGQGTDIGTVGLAEADDNTAVDVRLRGDSIDVYVDGSYQASFTIPADPKDTRAGMIAMPGVTAATWAAFDAQNAAALTEGFVPAEPTPTTLG